MNLLAIGDLFGGAGRRAVRQWLPSLREELGAECVVVNVENLHGGRGADAAEAADILRAGADCLTSGNHIWGHKGYEKTLAHEPRLLRPANYPAPCPGRGHTILVTGGGIRVAVINLQGRVFMVPVDDPFRTADRILDELKGHADVVAVDIHAEATSEKLALATYLDGQVAAVFGTHTHVQTADARVLPRGTGFITDLGMTGPYDSVIGMATEAALARFLSGRPAHNVPAEGGPGLRGALFTIDEATGRCIKVSRVARGAGGE